MQKTEAAPSAHVPTHTHFQIDCIAPDETPDLHPATARHGSPSPHAASYRSPVADPSYPADAPLQAAPQAPPERRAAHTTAAHPLPSGSPPAHFARTLWP